MENGIWVHIAVELFYCTTTTWSEPVGQSFAESNVLITPCTRLIYIYFFYINQNTTEVTCIQDLQTSIPICFYFGRKQMYLKHEIYTFWVQQQIQSVNLFFLRISTSASHWRFPRSPESFLSDLFWSPGSDWEQKNSLLPQWLADAAPGSPSGLDAGR